MNRRQLLGIGAAACAACCAAPLLVAAAGVTAVGIIGTLVFGLGALVAAAVVVTLLAAAHRRRRSASREPVPVNGPLRAPARPATRTTST